MPLQEQGVRLSVEGERQFLSAMQKAQGSVDGFSQKAMHGDKATKGLTASSMALATAMGQALYNGAMAAGRALGSFFSSAVTGASDFAETTSKTEVVFGSMADKVKAMGDTAATSLGMTSNAALTAASTYGNLFRSMGMTEESSADMSIGLVGLASDLASFNNMDPTEVMDKLRAGLVGESEPLKTLGVNINETIIKEKARELGLWNGVGALDANSKAQAAYALIMEQTSLAQGDFARTSGGLANQQRIAAANIENLKTKLGTGLLPIVTAVTKGFNKLIESPFFTGIIDKIIDGMDRFADSMEGVLEKISAGDFSGAFKELTSGIDIGSVFKSIFSGAQNFDMGTAIGDLLGKLLTKAAVNPAKLLQVGLNIINSLVGSLMTAIPALLPVAIELIDSLIKFVLDALPQLIDLGLDIIIKLADAVIDALPVLIDAAVEIIPTIVITLLENLPKIINAALNIIIALANGLITALPKLISMVPQIITAIFNTLITSLPMIGNAAVQLIMTLATGIINMLPQLGRDAGNILIAVRDGIVGLIPTLLETGGNIVSGIWQGILSKQAEFRENVKAFFKNIIDGVKDILGIKSPSKLFEDIGIKMVVGMEEGILDTAFKPAKAMMAAARMAIAPAMTAAQSSYAYSYATTNNYNLNLSTSQSPRVVQNSFAMMKMLAG